MHGYFGKERDRDDFRERHVRHQPLYCSCACTCGMLLCGRSLGSVRTEATNVKADNPARMLPRRAIIVRSQTNVTRGTREMQRLSLATC